MNRIRTKLKDDLNELIEIDEKNEHSLNSFFIRTKLNINENIRTE